MQQHEAHSAPGFGDPATWPKCSGHPNDPRTEDGDDFDAEEAASLIPLVWLECLDAASGGDNETPRDLGFVPCVGSVAGDRFLGRILDCTDAHWLLTLILNRPDWATPAARRAAELCKETPCWAAQVTQCQADHDKAMASAEAEAREAFELRAAA